jgi:hypothetical protein
MPYIYKKIKDKYCVYKKHGGKKKGCTRGTKTALKKYMSALHMNEKIKGADGKACWDGYRYAGTENGKDKCIPVKSKKEAKLPVTGFSRKEDMIMYQEGEMCNRCAADLLRDIQEGVYNDTITEAEYRGRKVKLNKPMRGDVKKFKVYVKDPKTGNIKKVNFGHGGTSAKKAGQKTMRIRKNNPKARKSFRARHNCENPGPKTKARYWSCRKW